MKRNAGSEELKLSSFRWTVSQETTGAVWFLIIRFADRFARNGDLSTRKTESKSFRAKNSHYLGLLGHLFARRSQRIVPLNQSLLAQSKEHSVYQRLVGVPGLVKPTELFSHSG